MAEHGFARFVSLACHDLRTPLATVHGFAKTLLRAEALTERSAKHLGMIEEASAEMGELLDQVALVARIEAGRYDPQLGEVDTLDLARAAAAGVRAGAVDVSGSGATVSVPVEPVERAVRDFATCALLHGGVEKVVLEARGAQLVISPTTIESAPVLTAEDLRDVGAAAGRRLVEALGGRVALEGEAFAITLPA